MWGIFNLFRRRKDDESFADLLTRLTKEISSLEIQQSHLLHQNRLVALFTFVIGAVYAAFVGAYLFYVGAPRNPLHLGICVGSLLLLLLARWAFKVVVGHRAKTCETKLAELKAQKIDVLGRVENEVPFKQAKELFEKFDPRSRRLRAMDDQNSAQRGQQPQRQQQPQEQGDAQQQNAGGATAVEGVRQRRPEQAAGGRPLGVGQGIQQQQQLAQQQQMLQHQQRVIAEQDSRLRAQQQQLRQLANGSCNSSDIKIQEPLPMYELKPGDVAGPAPGPPKPQPILPRERTSFDKVVEFLVGDGPNSRFALICKKCFSHNGMVQPSDFEYSTFRCAYCYELNAAKKPIAVPQPSAPQETAAEPAKQTAPVSKAPEVTAPTSKPTDKVEEQPSEPAKAEENVSPAVAPVAEESPTAPAAEDSS